MLGFHDLYERYSLDVFRFALYLCGDRAAAEDITAETFVRAWTAPGELRAVTVKSYLFAIARNVHNTEHRRQALRAEMPEYLPDPAPGPEHSTGERQRLRRLLTGLQRLPEVDRAALAMRVLEDMPYEQIAAALGLSVAAAKVKVHRARLKLAEST